MNDILNRGNNTTSASHASIARTLSKEIFELHLFLDVVLV